MDGYSGYNLNFKINDANNPVENWVDVGLNDSVYTFRYFTNPDNAIFYKDYSYTLKVDEVCFNPEKTIGFTMDNDTTVLMYIKDS